MADRPRLAIELPTGRRRPMSRAEPPSPERPLHFPRGYGVGQSPAMAAVHRHMNSLAGAHVPILITGETGVGKELIARILHLSSPRCEGPFVAVNCAAIPADLAEAELFGIERGVATGVHGRRGKFQQADGGTLFLDEIGEMPMNIQAKLLRALQEDEVQPIGGRTRLFNVWILAATNAELQERIEDSSFRSDLFFRLAGFRLDIPSLRQRPEDIPGLVSHFLHLGIETTGKQILGVTVEAMDQFVAHPWPGNIRQLKNEIRALVLRCSEGQAIDSSLLGARPATASGAEGQVLGPAPLDLEARVQDLEQALIEEALRRAHGVRSTAARLLGISRNRLARKMSRLGLSARRDLDP